MKEYAASFYKSKQWQDCRASYVKMVGGLCEDCMKHGIYKAGEIVHHKIHITPENIQDITITLSFDNLKLVCRECHAMEHGAHIKRYKCDDDGHVIAVR